MNAAAIARLRLSGFTLAADGDRLAVTGPALTEPQRAWLAKHKAAILLALDAEDAFEERSAIIHEAHTITFADDGAALAEPIFTLTQEQAETLAAQEQGYDDANSLHGESARRWAEEIDRLAKLPAVSHDGAEALKLAQAFITEGWALQAAQLGWL